jgi:hypothetical protein
MRRATRFLSIGLHVLVLALAATSARAVCLPSGERGGQTVTNDRKCCPGMVCGWGNLCQAGCRIFGSFYQNGVNPSNPCLSCQPQ